MRKTQKVAATQENAAPLASRLMNALAIMMPSGFYRKIMERRFIAFGVETTNICNADCSFCAYGMMERPKAIMPQDVYENAVRQFAQAGGGVINFTPTVGDPLVDKQIIDKIKFARAQTNIHEIFLYTNGLLLHRAGFGNIITSGLTRLALSTYIGTPEGYKKYYGVDKYEQALGNILKVAKTNANLGYPVNISLHLRVSTNENEWKKSQFYTEIINYIPEKNIQFLTEYDSWAGRISEDRLPAGCKVVKPMPLQEKIKEPCFELYRRIHILANGDVSACVCTDLEAEINIGNMSRDASLDKIWSGEKIRNYREDWKKGNIPRPCIECTRYLPVSEYIENNKRQIIKSYLRGQYPALFGFIKNIKNKKRLLNRD
ncbi:MAG: radical SAM protein [Gammaproteobacteria bacterium]